MKLGVVVALVLCILIVASGCSSITGSKPAGPALPESRLEEDVLETGIYYPTVNISVVHAELGFSADFYIEIHYALYKSEMFSSDIDSIALTDFAPLSKPLYHDSIHNVISAYVVNENVSYALQPVSYANKKLTLGGFQNPDRVQFVVEYFHSSPAEFTLEYTIPYDISSGYSLPPSNCNEWLHYPKKVTIDPFMTVAVPISLKIPKGAITQDTKFEFWVIAGEKIDTSTSGITQQKKYSQNWLVDLQVTRTY